MEIITQPTVTLISFPAFKPHYKYKVPPDGSPSESLIAHAGKGCYDAYGEDGRSIEKHISALIQSGHGSVLEHANVSVFIEGISRGCSHEIVRHRAGFAYSQRSTRYVDEGDCAIVLEPYLAELYFHDRAGHSLTVVEARILSDFLANCKYSIERYNALVVDLTTEAPNDLAPRDARKWARGKARQVLPHAIETRMTMTGNLRAWRHFLVQRSSRYAEAEIRRLAEAVYLSIQHLAPWVFGDFIVQEFDGFHVYVTETPKV